MKSIRLGTLVAALLFVSGALAQDQAPVVEVTISADEVAVGEPLTMRVSVYVPTWFAKPPQFPSFEISNAVTRLPPDSSRSTSKRFGRDSWSGVTRRYEIYPLMGARFRMESQNVVVYAANPGSDPVRVEIPTGEIAFRAIVPAGAEGLDPYVAGTRLEITREVEGDPSTLAVGDAVVVTYTAELEGLSSMFLPELLEETRIDGVSIYPEQPLVEDDGEIARRTEKFTYIFNAGGEFTVPAVSVDWWNRDTEQIETAAVSGLTLSVDGPPLDAPPSEPAPTINWRPIAIALVLLLFIWPRIRILLAADRAKRDAERRAWLASEEYAWRQARKALGGKDAHKAHDAVVRWLAKLDSGCDSRQLARRYGDEKLLAEIEKLNRSLYTENSDAANLSRIARGLEKARKRYLNERDSGLDVVLPPLNP